MNKSLGAIIFVIVSLRFSMYLVFTGDLFWVWALFDLSTIFLIPYLASQDVLNFEGGLFKRTGMYFVVQFLGSALILYSIIVKWFTGSALYVEWVLIFGFIIKLGLFPFHFWVPRVFKHLSYGGIFVVGAVQKGFMVYVIPIESFV